MNERMTFGSIRSHVLTGPAVKEKLAPRKKEGVVVPAASVEIFIEDAISAELSAWLPLRLDGPEE